MDCWHMPCLESSFICLKELHVTLYFILGKRGGGRFAYLGNSLRVVR